MERDEIDEISGELEQMLREVAATNQKIKDGTMVKKQNLDEMAEETLVEVDTGEEVSEPQVEVPAPRKPQPSKKKYVRKTREQSVGNGLLRSYDGLTAAFFVPVIVMIIIFAQRGIFPFGDDSFLRTDMYHQYAPFFSEFQNKLQHGGSLLYSWDIGMGVNFAALYAYYLASPLNWLVALVPKSLVIEFMTYSIVVKIGLSGLTMAYYLRRHNRPHDFGAAFFGIFYALSGYMAAYSWNIMWLDCILLFPLIVLGLERLVKEKKCFLYCVTLGLSILSNYYISIMICIFMVLYFFALLILEKRKNFREYLVNCFQFGIFSLLAGCLAAVVLLPEVYALSATASIETTFPKTLESYFSIFDMLARHIGNVQTEIGLDHWPNIYCGVAVYIFFLLYLICRRVSVKEKVVYCGLLLFFFASFSTNILNFVWHGFHYPNSLPCRQSFIYIFLMLFMCYRAYLYLSLNSKREIAVAFWGSVCFVLLAEKLVTEEHFHFVVYYVAILFLAMYTGLIYLYKNRRVSINIILILALGLVALESAVNTVVTSVTTVSRSAYVKDNRSVIELAEQARSNSKDFYRIDKSDQKTKNDGAWMNYPSVSLFSSTADASLTKFFKLMGCESSTNAYSINGSTPLIDSLMSVRYTLYPKPQPMNERQTLVDERDDVYLYENAYTLPLGYMLPGDIEQVWQYEMTNPADVQNNLCDVLNTPYVLEYNEVETQDQEMHFTAGREGDYFVYITKQKVETVTATIGEETKTFSNVNRGYLLKLGRLSAGQQVSLKTQEEGQTLEGKVYRFSYEGLEAVYDKLGSQAMELNSWTDTTLSGQLEVREDGLLFTSIPYDKGWSVKVDGVFVTPRELFDTFLAVEVPQGSHTIEFSYLPEGLTVGASITGAALASLAVIWLVGARKKKKTKE